MVAIYGLVEPSGGELLFMHLLGVLPVPSRVDDLLTNGEKP